MHFIANQWVPGVGKDFESTNPATGSSIWNGQSATEVEVNEAVIVAKKAYPAWAKLSFDERVQMLHRFNENLKKNRLEFQKIISQETGKPLWESDIEIGSAVSKMAISIEAYLDRCQTRTKALGAAKSVTYHKPHGVVAVLGPYNFPLHLPNGHIIPALLAGNTVVFKPSELTPWVAQKMISCWSDADLPMGVINMVQGGAETGALLSQHAGLDGILFTGSAKTGLILSKMYAKAPQKILALEMGGNNPLIVDKPTNIQAAVYNTLLSAFITSGQRCTCARRLILTKNAENEKFLEVLLHAIRKCTLGPYTDTPEPFMGPLISKEAADQVLESYEALVHRGAKVLVPMIRKKEQLAFVSPGLIDVTPIIPAVRDAEIFGPLLQVIWVNDLTEAIEEANHTEYGLSAGLFSDDLQSYQQFFSEIRAGIVNWNRPLTGASSHAPFGGIGKSGNHRPSAYYAADYCAYPVASLEQSELSMPEVLTPGIPVS
jgi:succinylglutamic semialdehyde dehydrogenase